MRDPASRSQSCGQDQEDVQSKPKGQMSRISTKLMPRSERTAGDDRGIVGDGTL